MVIYYSTIATTGTPQPVERRPTITTSPLTQRDHQRRCCPTNRETLISSGRCKSCCIERSSARLDAVLVYPRCIFGTPPDIGSILNNVLLCSSTTKWKYRANGAAPLRLLTTQPVYFGTIHLLNAGEKTLKFTIKLIIIYQQMTHFSILKVSFKPKGIFPFLNNMLFKDIQIRTDNNKQNKCNGGSK